MKLHKRVLENLVERRNRIQNGQINCIPLGLPRFEAEWPGVEQKSIIQVTANTKVGKTQVTDFLFLYNIILYAFKHKEKIRIKIFYFSLEMSKEQKYQQMMCHILWRISRGKIRITPQDLRSTSVKNPLPDEILEHLDSDFFKEYFAFFEECVEFIDDVRNGFGIYKILRDYASTHGTQFKKTIPITDKKTGEDKSIEVDDYYLAQDPDEYVFTIVDHMALLTPESGGSIRDAMVKFSSQYAILLRNKYKYIIVEVIQQAASQESIENFKAKKVRPTLDGYGEAKILSRDADIILGLFSPFRFELPVYEGYDIKYFRDNIRFLEIIAGREGGGGTLCPLFFDGGVNYFKELPLPDKIDDLKQTSKLVERVRDNNIWMLLHQRIKKERITYGNNCRNFWNVGRWKNNINHYKSRWGL